MTNEQLSLSAQLYFALMLPTKSRALDMVWGSRPALRSLCVEQHPKPVVASLACSLCYSRSSSRATCWRPSNNGNVLTSPRTQPERLSHQDVEVRRCERAAVVLALMQLYPLGIETKNVSSVEKGQFARRNMVTQRASQAQDRQRSWRKHTSSLRISAS